MEELHEAKDRWLYIGMNLKVSVSSLNGIEHDQHNISDRYRKMLQEWLQNGDDRSWKALAEALGRKSVGD